jgi:ABC transporter substrate binding protein
MRRRAGARRGVRLDSRQPSCTEVPNAADRACGRSCPLGRCRSGESYERDHEAPRVDRVCLHGVARVATGCARTTTDENRAPRIPGFRRPRAGGDPRRGTSGGVRDLEYVEGKNLVIEFRWSRTVEQMREAAAELARMKVDVIFASSSTEVEPARRATNTIPIVFAVHADPVGVGHVSSLARPGGNMTGLAMLQTGLTEKRLELLKAAVPQATRFGVF